MEKIRLNLISRVTFSLGFNNRGNTSGNRVGGGNGDRRNYNNYNQANGQGGGMIRFMLAF